MSSNNKWYHSAVALLVIIFMVSRPIQAQAEDSPINRFTVNTSEVEILTGNTIDPNSVMLKQIGMDYISGRMDYDDGIITFIFETTIPLNPKNEQIVFRDDLSEQRRIKYYVKVTTHPIEQHSQPKPFE